MKNLVFILLIGLFIVHQDFWLWDNPSLVFGFLPIGLAYHALYSILCGVVWAMAVKFSWPKNLEE